MRNAFAQAMSELAEERKDVVLLSGDIGNRMFDKFKEIAPSRFLNCGIAEANMMSVAAGMGLSGLRPVVYTITPFTTTRCLEQIRIGVAYHESPVVIVGTGSGLSYAELGATHHSLEDIAIMRTIPQMQVCTPTDAVELVAQLKDALNSDKPTYMRIGKKGEPILFNSLHNLGIGKANSLTKGSDVLVLAIGPITSNAIQASKILKKERAWEIEIATMGTIEPLDESFLFKKYNDGHRRWITIEEHFKKGGLGTTIIEWIMDNNIKDIDIKTIGVENQFIHTLGDQCYTRRINNLDAISIAKTIGERWN